MTQSLVKVDARSFPFVARIISTFKGNRRAVGSGTLISPRLILTAAHNIFDPAKPGGYAVKWRVALGGEGGVAVSTDDYDTTRQWVEQDSRSPYRAYSAFDFGVLILPNPVDSLISPIPVETMSESVLSARSMGILGYPRVYYPRLQLCGSAIDVWATESRLFYGVRTLPGMSGGPVYDAVTGPEGQKIRTVRGIHTAFFDEPGDRNDRGSALRITANVMELIREWMTRYAPA